MQSAAEQIEAILENRSLRRLSTSIFCLVDDLWVQEIRIREDILKRDVTLEVIRETDIGFNNPGPVEKFVFLNEAFKSLSTRGSNTRVFLETLKVYVTDAITAPSWTLVTNDQLFDLTSKLWQESLPLESSNIWPSEAETSRSQILEYYIRKNLEQYLFAEDTVGWNSFASFFRRRASFDNIRLSKKKLHGTNFSDCRLRGADFSECDLTTSSICSSNVTNSDFRKANMANVHAQDMNANGCNFEGASLKAAYLKRSCFEHANFRDAVLTETQLEGANFTRADFTGSNLERADLSKAILSHAIFKNANLTKAILEGADLRNTDLTNCTIAGARFKKAIFDETTILPGSIDVKSTRDMQWKGKGMSPFKQFQENIVPTLTVGSFDELMDNYRVHIPEEKLKNILKLLRTEQFKLFHETSSEKLTGIVLSQTNEKLVYACIIDKSGTISCMTQNLRRCGGLREGACKHIHVMLIGLAKANVLDSTTAIQLAIASYFNPPCLDKELSADLFLKYKGAEAGEVDWRPTETIPEDFYSY